ncbi:MAG: Si-specific NAD(P)(+) transhydrogenase [Phycisphaerales bacterium]|nr:Si-specific NAD(P)(+) transhydrogenase [Phycisphaerales bacterium]
MADETVSDTFDYDLVSIGSGPAGQRAAVQAAKLGHRVAIVEKRHCLGGVCIDTGTIPSKTFREAVLATSPFIGGSDVGGGIVPRPTAISLLSRVNGVVEREQRIVEQQLARNGVVTYRGEAHFVDPHTIEISLDDQTKRIRAANFVVAVGTRPTPPPGVPEHSGQVITSDEITRLGELPRTMVVVGGGVIGVEYASMFARLGVEVTVVDGREHLMEFMDREIIDELIHQMRDMNVVFRLGEKVETLAVPDPSVSRVVVTLASGKRIVSELVLFCIGRVGATASLGLEAAGLTADERGRLKVDGQYRTAVPHIFAAGDVIGYPALAATSSEQGRLAACHAFNAEVHAMSDHFPIGIYAIPEMSMVGVTEQTLTEQKVPYETGVARYREIARGQILGDRTGLFKMLFHRETRRLLGVHAIGTGATELIHIGQAVLGLGGGLDYFLDTVFNYPTLAECYKVAALDASNKLML